MKIALVGDIALFGKYSLENNSVYSYFSSVSEKLKEYDYVVGNLETPFCSSCKPKGWKSAFIKSDERNVELLKFLNINIVNLGNNHIFDYGIQGYLSTKKALKDNGVKFFGIENKQVKIEQGKNKIAFSGYCCYSTNGLGYYNPKTKIGVNILNAFEVEKQLIENHKEGYLNIVSFHVGQEHVNYPNYDHVKMARAFALKVPYVYYGHHPHVIQGIEKINDSLIAYSLGNFCFDDVYTNKSEKPLIKQSEQNKKSFILSLEINQNKIVKYEIIPLYMGKDTMNVGINDSILDEINIYSEFLSVDKKYYINTRKKLINDYINSRKKKRNLDWYLKRLNLNSIGIIINAKKNEKMYKKYVVEYLKEKGNY